MKRQIPIYLIADAACKRSYYTFMGHLGNLRCAHMAHTVEDAKGVVTRVVRNWEDERKLLDQGVMVYGLRCRDAEQNAHWVRRLRLFKARESLPNFGATIVKAILTIE